jgi:hypothetical protein
MLGGVAGGAGVGVCVGVGAGAAVGVATAVAPVVPLPLPPQPVSNSAIATTLATDLIVMRHPIIALLRRLIDISPV